MTTLTSQHGEIDFRYERGKLALDLGCRSGQEVQDQKNKLTVWIDECIQKVADFRVRFGLPRWPSNNRWVAEYWDATEGKAPLGAQVSRMLKSGRTGKRRWLDWQLRHPPGATDKVVKNQQHTGGEVKILRLHELMGKCEVTLNVGA